MAIVTVLWSFGAGIAIALSLVCGFVWLVGRRDLASLMLCLLGTAAAAAALGELGMMHSATAEEYGEWLRWYHLPVFLALVSLILFVHYYLGTGRRWLMQVIISARSFVLAVNFLVQPNFNFSNIASIRQVDFLGEQISAIAVAVPRVEFQWLATASLILMIAYFTDAIVTQWVRGDFDSRRKAAAVFLGILCPFLYCCIHTQLLIFGVVRVPLSNLPWFLGALLIMVVELERSIILSRRSRLELVELRSQMAQAGRVSAVGQLASALAHELSQPLAATAVSAGAALKHAQRERPDLEELRAILNDIANDNCRAIEIIHRMRQFFRRGNIQMQRLRVEDVVQDAILLVRAEANAKKTALHLRIQPDLPHVFGDRVHLSQVLLNLLMNSIHAMQSDPPGTRKIVVEVRTDDAKGEVEVAVRDSGPGIPDGIVDDIFKPFFTTKGEGMGIGLALSHTIIEAHGGRLWADRIPQSDGASLRFTLRQASSPRHAIDEGRCMSGRRAVLSESAGLTR